jgi:hypothetical protein
MNGKRYSTEDIIRIIPCRTVKPQKVSLSPCRIVIRHSVAEARVVEGGVADVAGGEGGTVG